MQTNLAHRTLLLLFLSQGCSRDAAVQPSANAAATASSACTIGSGGVVQSDVGSADGSYCTVNVAALNGYTIPSQHRHIISSNNPERFFTEGILFRTAFHFLDSEEVQSDGTVRFAPTGPLPAGDYHFFANHLYGYDSGPRLGLSPVVLHMILIPADGQPGGPLIAPGVQSIAATSYNEANPSAPFDLASTPPSTPPLALPMRALVYDYPLGSQAMIEGQQAEISLRFVLDKPYFFAFVATPKLGSQHAEVARALEWLYAHDPGKRVAARGTINPCDRTHNGQPHGVFESDVLRSSVDVQLTSIPGIPGTRGVDLLVNQDHLSLDGAGAGSPPFQDLLYDDQNGCSYNGNFHVILDLALNLHLDPGTIDNNVKLEMAPAPSSIVWFNGAVEWSEDGVPANPPAEGVCFKTNKGSQKCEVNSEITSLPTLANDTTFDVQIAVPAWSSSGERLRITYTPQQNACNSGVSTASTIPGVDPCMPPPPPPPPNPMQCPGWPGAPDQCVQEFEGFEYTCGCPGGCLYKRFAGQTTCTGCSPYENQVTCGYTAVPGQLYGPIGPDPRTVTCVCVPQ